MFFFFAIYCFQNRSFLVWLTGWSVERINDKPVVNFRLIANPIFYHDSLCFIYVVSTHEAFVSRVEYSIDLLNPDMDFSTLTSLERVLTPLCTCNDGKTECNYISYTDCGTITNGKQYPCRVRSAISRRKRHADYTKSLDRRSVANTEELVKFRMSYHRLFSFHKIHFKNILVRTQRYSFVLQISE
jgi:hypothetical protein